MKCTMCGKEFDEWDLQQDFKISQPVYYGSVFDGDKIDIHFCCDCFDDFVKEYILPNCMEYPVLNYDE